VDRRDSFRRMIGPFGPRGPRRPFGTRRHVVFACVVGSLVGASCSLLQPYPGGGEPARAFTSGDSGIDGGEEEPLLDPPTDDSVSVINNLDDVVVALPGASFPISLNFQAPMRNVVGGGIRFQGSDEIQWTLLERVMQEQTGDVDFAYVMAGDACDGLSNLCHEVDAEQFVVTELGNDFAVSEAIAVTVVLQCATCDSTSCVAALPPGTCQECVRPDACSDVFNNCFAGGAPYEGTSEAILFDNFFGEQGVLWRSAATCVEGEALCDLLIEEDRCEF